ncbi:MAG: lysozyme [Acetobacteraceae bacterium]|nr:lysozyme [Acetobacteraceae bacterium]
MFVKSIKAAGEVPLSQTNDRGLALIMRFEGLKLDAYQDVAGIWTIGYGHVRGVHPGMHLTEEQAQQALRDDLHLAEHVVDDSTRNATTSDNQFSAMVSLCFNIGAANFRGSTVLKKHLTGDHTAAADAFLMWNKARVGGVLQEVVGLTNRRAAERQLYIS